MYERIVELTPAWDRRSNDPKKNYGVHNVDLRMLVKGEHGATQFVLSTGWLLPETIGITSETMYKYSKHLAFRNTSDLFPMVIDLGYHARKPQYEDQWQSPECEYVPEGRCYYDGSSLDAYRVFEILLREGHYGVWKELEDYYRELFET